MQYLPGTIVSRDPFIFISFFEDFVTSREKFAEYFERLRKAEPGKRIYAVFQIGYEAETEERMAYMKENLDIMAKTLPYVEATVLCNSLIELENFRRIGAHAIFCNQNTFLDERRYRTRKAKKIYDAVYLARITPFKRHTLLEGIKNLYLIGDYKVKEQAYAENTLKMLLPNAVWKRRVYGLLVYWHLTKAHCGLCLSKREGSMYASAEYGLCGLGIVNTKNMGGRENSFSEKYTYTIDSDEPTPAEVQAGIDFIKAANYDPAKVRQATIDKFTEHRLRYGELIDSIFEKCGKKGRSAKAKKIFHKMALRCKVHFWTRLSRGMKL